MDSLTASGLTVSVTKEDQQAAYAKLLVSESFTPACIGKTNPYTGGTIRTEQDYDLYLRERAFHLACEAKYVRSVVPGVEAERIRLDDLDRQRMRAFEQDYRLRCQKTFAVLALVLVLLCGFFSYTRYRSGYEAAEVELSDVSASEYQKGYDLGYADGKNNYQSFAPTRSSSSTRSGAAYDSAIIGNKNTKKFHGSDCSYLPNKSNQIPFDSREEAIAAGYDSCGHCGGR